MIKCYLCKKELIWNNNYTYEDYGLEGDGTVSHFSCLDNDCEVEEVLIYRKHN